MQRTDIWILSVEYFPNGRIGDDGFIDDPHVFHFAHPPTRQDFLAVCAQLPWTHCWRALPVIAGHDWPLITQCHKSAAVDLLDGEKRIGRIGVSRNYTYANQDVFVPDIFDECHEVTRRCKDPSAAASFLLDRQYEIKERCTNEPLDIKAECRRVLVEGGFLKGGKRAKKNAV